ncbi:MAG: N-acetylglucosamine-6-phosphate deacetylase, partial [Alphaproteobacteria bacterium]
MSVQAISAPLVLAADGLRRDHAVLVDDAMILDIVPQHAVPPGLTVTAHAHGLLAPGFVDVQVNGGGGVLFNDAPTVDTIRTMAAAHRRYGTTAMLPTLISDDWDKTVQALEAVDAAIAEGVPGIVGIHLEGPFLNPAKKGIHDAGKFRVLDDAAVAFLCRPRRGAVLMTLAPERAELAHIRALAEAGVVLAAGHSLARYEEIEAAVRAGLRGVTHLFNAMSPLESRAPGLVGAALDLPALWAGIIADGFHVHPAALRLAVRAKGVERVMLVTDAMATVGADIASFM